MQPTSSNQSGERNAANIQSVQIMRAIACILVVLLHISIKGSQYGIFGSSVILLVLVIVGQLFTYDGLLFKFSTHILYIEFVLGMACFYLFNKGIIRLAPKYGIAWCMLGSLLLVLELIFKLPVQDKWRGITWGIPMLFIFIGLLCLEGVIKRNTSIVKNLFLEIGNSSYSLYLIQPFTLSGTAMCLKWLKMTTSPYLFTVVLLGVSIVVGHLVYLYIERPLISLMKNPVLQPLPRARSRAMEKVS